VLEQVRDARHAGMLIHRPDLGDPSGGDARRAFALDQQNLHPVVEANFLHRDLLRPSRRKAETKQNNIVSNVRQTKTIENVKSI